jgi:hypothetical protein
MGISNSKVIKAGVDALTGLLNVVNKLTGKSGLLKLGAAIGALKGGSAIFNKLFKTTSLFGGQKNDNNGQKDKLGILKSLTQGIKNFNKKEGISLEADIDTTKVKNKIEEIKNKWTDFGSALTERKPPAGVLVGFETLDNKLVSTSVIAEGTTESIEAGLSQVSAKAIMASANADGLGDQLKESGVSSFYAMKVLEEQIEELNKDLALAKWLGEDVEAINI